MEFREDYVPKLANRIGLSYKKTKSVSRETSAEEVQKNKRKSKWIYWSEKHWTIFLWFLLSALNTPCSYEPVFKLKYIRKNETDIKRKIRYITQVCEFSGEISTYFGLPAHFRAGKYS